VGYFFGSELHKSVKVPIGLIVSAWGGTPAEAWTPREVLERDFPPTIQRHPPDSNKRASCLYNAMLHPLLPYAMRGVIWYQGEANNQYAQEYRTLFPAMIASWRKAWNQENLPFLFVQIAPFQAMSPELREAQLLTWKTTPHTAMVVTTDVGDAKNIHPANKRPVGERLALAARALAYGEKLEYSGPVYESMTVQGSKAVVTFGHYGSGLLAKDGELKGFVIAGKDLKFVSAKAEIKGQTVIVSSETVPSPVAVRYGWENVPDVNLYNQEGLPASPFRTDVP
jgi:sialate O-acetylesterase